MWIAFLFAATTLLFLLPLLPALVELRLRRDIEPVAVDPANAGNIDYFAESFLEFISPAIDAYQAGKTQRLIDQDYSLYSGDSRFEANADESRQARSDRLIVGLGDLQLPDNFNFSQEIFSRGNIDCGERNRLRSVLAIGRLQLGQNSQLLRWAHAQHIVVGGGSLLLGRVSAESELVLQPRCEFTRLNAGRISVSPEPEPLDPADTELASVEVTALKSYADASGRVLLDKNLDFPERGTWNGDLVIRGDALIGKYACIKGSLKVYGDIRIESGVTIGGTVVCHGRIAIGKHSKLLGPVVSEQRIAIDSGSCIGSATSPSTVTAPEIRIAAGAVVHGTLWARNRGEAVQTLDASRALRLSDRQRS